MRPSLCVFFVPVLLATALAQSTVQLPAFTSVPIIEDVELYAAFFSYQQGLIATMNAAITADPTKATQLNQQMAATLGVTSAELPSIISTLQQVTQHYSNLAADSKAGNLTLPQGAPAPTAAQSAAAFQFQRVRLTTGAVVALFQQLSAASWKALHSYIVGTYKTNIYQH